MYTIAGFSKEDGKVYFRVGLGAIELKSYVVECIQNEDDFILARGCAETGYKTVMMWINGLVSYDYAAGIPEDVITCFNYNMF